MSLQVQSSQPAAAPSGRRTPQVYQNLVANSPSTPAATSATPPTNGNSSNNKSSTGSKLSLKSSSGKSSPASSGKASPAPTQPVVTVTPPTPQATAVTPQKVVEPQQQVSDAKTASPVKDSAEKKGEVTNGKETNGKHEEEPVKESPRKETAKASPKVTPQKSIPVEQVKTPETVSPKKPAATKEVKEVAAAPEAGKKKVDNSLVAEKTLKGFTAEGDEMESLVVEPSEYEDSPMPPRTGGKSKLLKGGPPTRARISPFRVAQEAAIAANASTVVNLSTVSEGQHTESNESSPAVDFNRPLRAISGRRSTRPLTDTPYQYQYRKPAVNLNDSSSSLNVTVGSEIHNDSLRTPAGLGSSRKRKAMTPESTSDALDVKEQTDSPKRTRLDFSGFLGIVASPVTMLKNRFSRVRLHASTPVAKRSFDAEEDLVGKIVTAEATTTTANISGDAAADNKMEVEAAAETADKNPEDETTIKEGQTEVPADVSKETTSTAEEAVEIKDVTDKQRRCVIM